MSALMDRRDFIFQLAAVAPTAHLTGARTLAAKHGRLEIARVDPYVVRIGSREDVVVCRVETADGLHGWGEGTSPPNVGPVAAQIRSLGRLIQGERAWDTEKIWRRMYIAEENTLGGTLYAAMSAIDIALWDILGKALDVPVHDLLGGRVWNTLRIYTSYRWGNIPRTAKAYRDRTRELITQGVRAGKYDPFGPYPEPSRQLPTSILNEVREMLRGIREASADFDICVECHGKFNVASAGRIIRMAEPFDPFFVEEPLPPENVDALAALQASTNVPIATAEGIQGHFPYQELLAKQAARIWQPDVARVGGITAMKKNRRHRGHWLHHNRPAQSERAGLHRGQHPPRCVDPELSHHGGGQQGNRSIRRHLRGRLGTGAGRMAHSGRLRPRRRPHPRVSAGVRNQALSRAGAGSRPASRRGTLVRGSVSRATICRSVAPVAHAVTDQLGIHANTVRDRHEEDGQGHKR